MILVSFQKFLNSVLSKPLLQSPESKTMDSFLNVPVSIYDKENDEDADYEIIDGIYDDYRSKIQKMSRNQLIKLINKGISFDQYFKKKN
jgi:hypothetical protein